MSLLFPRFNEISPLFQLADEFDRATRSGQLRSSNTRSFTPRFDVKETKEAYELHGELPGIEQSNINIEWTDDNTLTVQGHTEHTYESSEALRVTDAEDGSHSHQPTVEEEGESATKTEAHDQTMTKTDEKKEVAQPNEDRPRFWVSERSYGSFHRSFQFPAAVDHDNVKASLNNGILKIVISKQVKAREPRKIVIQ